MKYRCAGRTPWTERSVKTALAMATTLYGWEQRLRQADHMRH